MRNTFVHALIGLICLAPAAGGEAVAEALTIREGAWFRVVCHFEHDRAADEALAAVEAVGPLAARLYGLRQPDAGKQLEVHLYRTVADYEAAEEKLTGGRFKRNLAFAHHESHTAHVAVQPPVSEEVLDQLGLPHLTQNLLAHEASHIVRFRAMPSFRSHPMWVVDGAAIWLAVQGELARKRIASIEACPLSATEICHGQRLLEQGRLPKVRDLLHDRTDELEFYERYASRWLLFQFLASGPYAEGLRKAMWKLRQMGGGSTFANRLEERLVAATASTDALDTAFRAWLKGLRPIWREAIRSLDAQGDAWVQAAWPDRNAVAWRTQPVGLRRYDVSGRMEVFPGTNMQMNILLDKTDAGFVSVAMRTDGWITVFEYESDGSRWNRRGAVEHAALKRAGPVSFRIRVQNERVTVIVGDEEALVVELAGRTMDGPWGLGAQWGTCGVWHDVRVAATPADPLTR